MPDWSTNGDFRLDGIFFENLFISLKVLSINIIERLELCMTTCSRIRDFIRRSTEQDNLHCTLSELSQCLHSILKQWEDYKSSIQHHVPLPHSNIDPYPGRRRPSFNISRGVLLEYYLLFLLSGQKLQILSVSAE